MRNALEGHAKGYYEDINFEERTQYPIYRKLLKNLKAYEQSSSRGHHLREIRDRIFDLTW